MEQVPVAVEQVATRHGRAAAQVLAALVVVAGAGADGGARNRGTGVWRGQGYNVRSVRFGVVVRSHL